MPTTSQSFARYEERSLLFTHMLPLFNKGNEADAFLCLTEWTKEVDLSAECIAVLPKKEKPKEEKKSRASEKRRAHKQAMKELKQRQKAEKEAERRK